ncbi:MAG: elongation factor Ts [Gammaproteobacteria bacterium]|nr:elongation factor Ts [Gammaproteobacteria bacterium]
MSVSAAMVKELRERTSLGMLECKKALTETGSDIDAAVELLRKSGQAKADKKEGRIAAEGCIVQLISDDGKTAAIVEVNCETDFVANSDEFGEFAALIAQRVIADQPVDVAALEQLAFDASKSIDVRRKEMMAKLGEKLSIRRFQRFESDGGQLDGYMHGVRIGVLVDIAPGNTTLGKDVAMHIAASRPIAISEDDVDQATLAKEKEIFEVQAAESGKPAEIIEKMVAGRMRKFLAEVTLLGQPFVKDPDLSVAKLLDKSNSSVKQFIRFEVGEGIEKKVENFAEEVAAQVAQSK